MPNRKDQEWGDSSISEACGLVAGGLVILQVIFSD
jgi:hypothetical protein